MSFIYENPWLIQELLKSAQGTPAPTQSPTPRPPKDAATQSVQLAKELVQNLYNELAGGFSFTAERENADLSAAHVVNVDELLYFLEFNGVKANGHNLVMKANVFVDQNGKLKPNMAEMAKWYVPYPVQGNPNYYLYKDGMIGFLDDLAKKAENNPMLKAIVAKLRATLSAALPQKTTPQTEAAGDSTTPQVSPQQAGQGLSGVSPQILQQLSSLRPFNSQFISFGEIQKFLDLYNKYANDPTVKQMVDRINQDIGYFKSRTNMGSDTIQLYNFTTDAFKMLLRNPRDGINAAALLHEIIVYAGQLYQRLVTSLQTLAQDAERAKYIDYRGMQQQVAPGGPQLTNVNTLNRLKFNLDEEGNRQK